MKFKLTLQLLVLIALAAVFGAGCESAAPEQPLHVAWVWPQDFANMDVQHDHTSYQSGFCTNADRTFPILFIVGDSTVHNVSGGRVGWGDVLGSFFDTNKIRVENHALAGRSSRTFITQGWWNLVLKEAKPGDFVLIQLGHNDGGPIDDTSRARGTLPGVGSESTNIFNPVTQKPETVHTYGWYLREYISDARARGITPLLCTPLSRLPQPGKELDTTRYAAWMHEVATEENAPLIDLNRRVLVRWQGRTPAELKAEYFTPQDNTHFNAAGAELNAEAVVTGLRGLECPLKNYLLEPSPAEGK